MQLVLIMRKYTSSLELNISKFYTTNFQCNHWNISTLYHNLMSIGHGVH